VVAGMIDLTRVSKRFAGRDVLEEVSLSVKRGEFISIRGKSGTGKTTLLKIMGLLEQPDEGEVALLGKNVRGWGDGELSRLRLEDVGFVFQFFNLIPSLTVMENIELPLALAGVAKSKRKERVMELLSYFGLTSLAARFPENLSGGEKQRVGLMRALSNDPQIVLADEPTSSLDDENSALLVDLFCKISSEKNVSVVMTSTDLYEKLPTSKDYLLKEGRLRQIR
jgi:putative ABC transport system ATP-binding protein